MRNNRSAPPSAMWLQAEEVRETGQDGLPQRCFHCLAQIFTAIFGVNMGYPSTSRYIKINSRYIKCKPNMLENVDIIWGYRSKP